MTLAACGNPTDTGNGANTGSRDDGANGRLYYGKAAALGKGTIRSYVVVDKTAPGTPLEIGVAMSESAMDSLPATMPTGLGGVMLMNTLLLDLPETNPTPYKFVQFDWNPMGHEPAGVYDLPHFDFHFYTVPVAIRNSIVTTDPAYAQKAANFPAPQYRAAFYLDAATPAGVPPSAAAVPEMGLHWVDVRSPELQGMIGNPGAYKPFTATFIYGSWNGQFIFDEPMITRAHILAKRTTTDVSVRDEIMPVSVAHKHAQPGFYPGAYRIMWDATQKEYRIALTQLEQRL
jgi:hypothetical protein